MKTMARALVALVMALAGWATAGEDAAKPDAGTEKADAPATPTKAEEIPEVKAEAEKYKQALEPLAKAYEKALDAEEGKATKAGSLETLEAIKKERESVTAKAGEPSGATWDKAKAKSLAAAQKAYNDGLSKARKGYAGKLEGIQKKLVQDKKIDEAKLVRDYIDEMKNEEVKRNFCGTWKYNNGVVQTYLPSGEAESNGVKSGKWTIKSDRVEIAWENGFVDTFMLPIDGKILLMTNSKGDKAKAEKVEK